MDRAANRRRSTQAQLIEKSASRVVESLELRVLLSGSATSLDQSQAVFIQNHGQWDKSVSYALQTSAANVLMTDHGPIFQIFDHNSTAGKVGEQFFAQFDGANIVRPTGDDRSAAQFNYFVGDPSQWKTNVPGFEKVVYNGIYDGIDLYAGGKQSSLKYEFHVAAGADPNQVKISYSGIEGLSVDHLGRLHVQTATGQLIDDAPFVYQTINGKRVEVKAQFKLLDNDTYAFQLNGSYDKSQELVIDPDLTWSTFLGGGSTDVGNGIASDNGGNAYVTGETSSAAFPTTNGFNTVVAGTDAFVSKLDPAGQLLWSTFLGGSSSDFGAAIAVDNAGNPYITGQTSSANFPTTGGFDTTLNGFTDAFVTKLTTNGALTWSSYLGGGSSDNGAGIDVDGSGVVYVGGSTTSSDFPSSGGFQLTRGGSSDGFVTAINKNPVAIKYSSFLGGNNTDTISGLNVNGGVIGVVGTTQSTTGLATFGATQTSLAGSSDAFVASITASSAALQWATYLGGSDFDTGTAINVSTAGIISVTGGTSSSNFPLLTAFDNVIGAFQKAFVTRYTAPGALQFSTFLGNGGGGAASGSGSASGQGIFVDNAGTT